MATILATGGFADLIAVSDGSVAKAFRRQPHTHDPVRKWEHQEELTRAMYRSELTAYERLRDFPDLEVFAPRFFGPVAIAELELDATKYVKGCAFRMERILGRAVKIGLVDESKQVLVTDVLRRWRTEVGITCASDGSCFFPGSRSAFTIIDFSMRDVFAECEPLLAMNGEFTEAQLEMLRIQ